MVRYRTVPTIGCATYIIVCSKFCYAFFVNLYNFVNDNDSYNEMTIVNSNNDDREENYHSDNNNDNFRHDNDCKNKGDNNEKI